MKAEIKYILFDAANTLIHKPMLWKNILEVFRKNGIEVSEQELKMKHKLLSEVIHFPDVTSQDFYIHFNSELCRLLGIVPNHQLVVDLFKACTYLPWVAFEDALELKNINMPIGVLSNFNKGLPELLAKVLPEISFQDIIVSENEKVAKPSVEFYKKAIEKIGLPPHQILYIGDSIKLDIEPALQVGMQVKLIDRDSIFLSNKNRITTLKSLSLDEK